MFAGIYDYFFSRLGLVVPRHADSKWMCHLRSEAVVKYWNIFYTYYNSTVYCYFPFSTMFILNIAIVIKLLHAKLGDNKGSVTLSKTSYGLSVMLVVTCLVFAICSFPFALFYEAKIETSAITYTLIVIAFYTNHSINIIFYVIANKRFRAMVLKVICGRLFKIEPEETVGGSTVTSNQRSTHE